MPMFSPSCGSTRTTTGPARSTPDLVLSVPDPDISLHFLIRRLKIPNQVPKNLIRHPSAGRISIACPVAFLKQNNGLVKPSRSRSKPQEVVARWRLARVRLSDTVTNHNQNEPVNEPKSRLNGSGQPAGSMVTSRTARALYTPAITHPAEHTSHETIGYSLDWFSRTLQGGMPRRSDDQIRFAKEIGTLIALAGFVALLIGVFDGLLKRPLAPEMA